jgi:hypothetical protein
MRVGFRVWGFVSMQKMWILRRETLNPKPSFLQADMNDDQFVSTNEWNVFRHYVAAFLVSNAGPTMAPADGRPLADGPYGNPRP